MSDRYSGDQLFHVEFPQWTKSADGRWTRTWSIRLLEPVDPGLNAADLSRRLTGEEIDAEVVLSSDRITMHIVTSTRRNAYSDEVFHLAAYKMLKFIDSDVARIDTIQGQPRSAWQPFRPLD